MCHRVSQARPTKLVKANLDKSRSKHIGSLVAEHIECTFWIQQEIWWLIPFVYIVA